MHSRRANGWPGAAGAAGRRLRSIVFDLFAGGEPLPRRRSPQTSTAAA
jgi:hypothetical protein